jgi:hypothetical protein
LKAARLAGHLAENGVDPDLARSLAEHQFRWLLGWLAVVTVGILLDLLR